MRYLMLSLILITQSVAAETPPPQFDPVQFEKRFHKADKGHKGKLSREEAFAEFTRMPEFFDEIDADKDGFITLAEVNKAMGKRVNAAIAASQGSQRYGGATLEKSDGANAGEAAGAQTPAFSSKAEERRYYRNQYYESLAGEKATARDRGEPVSKSPSSPILQKSF
jgi:hypothetical protein